jgi:hypothetical protein
VTHSSASQQSATAVANRPEAIAPPTEGRKRIPRWLRWSGIALLLVVAGLGIAADYVARHAEPILRKRVIATLEDRFQSPVELDTLHISVLHGLQVTGGGLRILYLGSLEKAHDPNQPTLSVRSFEFRTGFLQLFQHTMRIGLVRVQGMQLNIPSRAERGPLLPHPSQDKRANRSIVVDKVVCSDMVLTIETGGPGRAPGKQPLVFNIRDVTLHDVGAGRAFPFDAWLVNAKPVGDIHSTGHFGPWHAGEPRDTPVDGNYSFTHANMATIKGISGTLSSTGSYGGTLGEIGVAGTTDTPDFALDVSEHPVDLRTEFNATVDGTSGNTILNSVHATLRQTVLDVTGKVVRATDAQAEAGLPGDNPVRIPGHLIDLSVTSNQARIEDLLTLGAKTDPPVLHGAMTLRAHLSIPPGHVSVSQKMRVQGTFAIRGATFSNPNWQQTVDKLSERASGNPEQANAREARRVASQMAGSFDLENATLAIPRLDYQMPGAQVDLIGKYSLDGNAFDFNGTVRTKATASAMLTGWKSILAMPLDPLLKKNGAGLEVPITISGTRSQPKFGVNLGKLGAQIFSRHQDRKPQPQVQHP